MENPLIMEAGQLLCIQNGMGMCLFVCEGLGILTEEHEWGDVVLKAGRDVLLQRQGKAIFMARTRTSLRLAVPPGRKARLEVKTYRGHCPIVLKAWEVSARRPMLCG
jgi:hypothetical protein